MTGHKNSSVVVTSEVLIYVKQRNLRVRCVTKELMPIFFRVIMICISRRNKNVFLQCKAGEQGLSLFL